MILPRIPFNEWQRIEALHEMDVLNNACEESFDTLAEIAKVLFDVPIALVSFVDTDRQFFKVRIGLEDRQMARDISICGHAILESKPLVIEDTLDDERFFDNPLVSDGPRLRFYAGAQIRTMDELCVGTLCVADVVPRKPTSVQIKHLELLARLGAQLLEPRRQAARAYRMRVA
jgi:GAF domain-containing protein